MKHRLIKRFSFVLALLTMATVLTTGCAPEIFSGGDQYICVLNTKTGEIKKEIPPGDTTGYRYGDDKISYAVPTSNRFLNINTDRTIADDGAPAWIETTSKGIKDVRTIGQARFVFKETEICRFVLKHVKRNDKDDNQDFEFNKRPDGNKYSPKTGKAYTVSNSEWVGWLNENMAVAMEKTLRPLTREYAWQSLEFNFPTNAKKDGNIPDGVTPSELTWRQIELDWGKALSDELKIKVGGEFFCGLTYDSKKPDFCPPIDMDVQKIWMVDREPVKALQKLDNDRDARDIAEASATIAGDTLDQKKTSAAANEELANLEIIEANKQAEVASAKANAAAKTKASDIIASDTELQKCLVLIDAVGTCPMLEESKARNVGNTNVTISPQPGG